MTGTRAVPSKLLDDAAMRGPGGGGPLCPACIGGRLHPYKVEFSFGPLGYEGLRGLSGWVAVCQGEEGLEREIPPCGFSIPLQPVPGGLRGIA